MELIIDDPKIRYIEIYEYYFLNESESLATFKVDKIILICTIIKKKKRFS